jgi:glutamyl-tRNA reductase
VRILLVGVNHRTAPVELRERVVFPADVAGRAACELRAGRGFSEAVVFSTCNRTEAYAVAPEPASNAEEALGGFLSDFHGVSREELDASLYRYRDTDAVEHLFRVAAGLDSMLLGEAEILGQVREAYKAAVDAGTTGPVLNRLFQGALEVGKRVRAETDLGTRPMSVAFAAVKLAEQIFGNLRQHQSLLLGAGAVGEQVAEHLRNRKIAGITVANRSRERGEELARRFGGRAAGWDALGTALVAADILVASVSSAEPVVPRGMVEQAMRTRKNRALFVIDLGVPRNVDPGVAEIYNVYLYNVDDLTEIVEQNRRARQSEVPRAEAIIADHVAKFEAWQAGMLMRALLEELQEKLRHEREAFLREHREQIRRLSPEDRQQFGTLAEGLLDHLVREPLGHPRELRPKRHEIEAVREFFGLVREKR